jgi:hypothetical protein
VTPEKKGKFFLQDSARPHKSIPARETTVEFGWTDLPCQLYRPGFPITDFNVFGPMSDSLYGKHFADDDAVSEANKKWLLEDDSNFYERGMRTMVQQWRKCIKSGGE